MGPTFLKCFLFNFEIFSFHNRQAVSDGRVQEEEARDAKRLLEQTLEEARLKDDEALRLRDQLEAARLKMEDHERQLEATTGSTELQLPEMTLTDAHLTQQETVVGLLVEVSYSWEFHGTSTWNGNENPSAGE